MIAVLVGEHHGLEPLEINARGLGPLLQRASGEAGIHQYGAATAAHGDRVAATAGAEYRDPHPVTACW